MAFISVSQLVIFFTFLFVMAAVFGLIAIGLDPIGRWLSGEKSNEAQVRPRSLRYIVVHCLSGAALIYMILKLANDL
jgi:hypothetical protein